MNNAKNLMHTFDVSVIQMTMNLYCLLRQCGLAKAKPNAGKIAGQQPNQTFDRFSSASAASSASPGHNVLSLLTPVKML